MDKETQAFIENQNKALMEDISGIIRDMGTIMEAKVENDVAALRRDLGTLNIDIAVIKKETANLSLKLEEVKMDVSMIKRETAALRLDFEGVKADVQETKTAVLRIEHTLQDKQEAQGDLIQDTRQRMERIEDHLHLPHSLSATA